MVLRYLSGLIALLLLAVSLVYVVMKLLLRANLEKYHQKLNIEKWFGIHEWSSWGFCLAVILHWSFSDQGNALLHLSLASVIVLTLSGMSFRYGLLKVEPGKKMLWIYSQRFLLCALILLAILGHGHLFIVNW